MYTRRYIILYTYLLLSYISVMYVEREKEREEERVSERTSVKESSVIERRAKKDYANVYCIYVGVWVAWKYYYGVGEGLIPVRYVVVYTRALK